MVARCVKLDDVFDVQHPHDAPRKHGGFRGAGKFFWFGFIIFLTLNLMCFYGVMGVYITPDLIVGTVLSAFFYGFWCVRTQSRAALWHFPRAIILIPCGNNLHICGLSSALRSCRNRMKPRCWAVPVCSCHSCRDCRVPLCVAAQESVRWLHRCRTEDGTLVEVVLLVRFVGPACPVALVTSAASDCSLRMA